MIVFLDQVNLEGAAVDRVAFAADSQANLGDSNASDRGVLARSQTNRNSEFQSFCPADS